MIKMNKALARDILNRANAGASDSSIAAALGLSVKQVRTVRTGQLWSKLRSRMLGTGVVPAPAWSAPAPAWSAPAKPKPVKSGIFTHSSAQVPLPQVASDEPLVGFRMWYVSADGKPEASSASNVEWESSMSAICAQDDSHQAPVESCECGIHANNTVKAMELRIGSHYTGSPGKFVVVGAVMLTGRIVEASAGFRAERAKVIAVATPCISGVYVDDEYTATVAYNLNVPKVPYDSLAAYAEEFGQIRDHESYVSKAKRLAEHERLRQEQESTRKAS